MAVAAGEGADVAVSVGGTEVKVKVADGTAEGVTAVAGICVQATNEIKSKILKTKRVM